MKAVYIEQFGGPEVVKYNELPDPSAGAGQVVVDAFAASVNGADWKVRVGDYNVDNTHKISGGQPAYEPSPGTPAPLDDDAAVLRRAIWLETDKQYRAAAEALVRIQTNKEVEAQSAE